MNVRDNRLRNFIIAFEAERNVAFLILIVFLTVRVLVFKQIQDVVDRASNVERVSFGDESAHKFVKHSVYTHKSELNVLDGLANDCQQVFAIAGISVRANYSVKSFLGLRHVVIDCTHWARTYRFSIVTVCLPVAALQVVDLQDHKSAVLLIENDIFL